MQNGGMEQIMNNPCVSVSLPRLERLSLEGWTSTPSAPPLVLPNSVVLTLSRSLHRMMQRMMNGMGGGGGGAGGMPDINELMQDPTMRRMAEQFGSAMGGGAGGAGGRGGQGGQGGEGNGNMYS